MKKVRNPSVIEVSKEELVKFQLKYIIPPGIKLNEQEYNVLAYIYVNGREGMEKMVKDGHMTSYKAVENYVSNLRKVGLIIGTASKTKLREFIKPIINDMEYVLTFKVVSHDQMDSEL